MSYTLASIWILRLILLRRALFMAYASMVHALIAGGTL